ncbi:flavin-containing monooxygenase [Elongatibacter sediminis]|uniref:NAD(P)/FAD-dependent oxidoreductase n=1 Tax=Elongatibacter sediminis TaxID=3119006 RepID=A0AAW9RNZ2_9GAMM
MASTSDPTRPTVAIIGAGIAGLCTARVLGKLGFEPTLYEKEAELGGVWAASRRYPGLTTQNPRTTYEFSDFPMPRDYPEWPSGTQVQAYLEQYAQHFGITENLELNAEVRSLEYDTERKRWNIAWAPSGSDQEAAVHERTFDYVVVCNGIFSVPMIPRFPGDERFAGQIIHTSEFNDVEAARDRNVVIIGYGKSACDAANATVGISRKTTVVARSLIWKIPKKIYNILNFKYLFLTRLGEGLFPYIRIRGFEKFLHGPGKPVRNFAMNSVEATVAKQLQLERIGLRPNKPLESIARSTVSLVTDGFYEKIQSGELGFEKAEIKNLTEDAMELSNGKTVPADLIVCGTGWNQTTPFFSAEQMKKITDERGNYRLYRSMVPVGVPQLAFNGYNSSFFSQLNAEIGAYWIAALFLGQIELPAEDEMNRRIDQRLAWMEARTDGKHSKGTNIIPFSIHQMDELLADLDAGFNPVSRLSQWLMPVTGSNYRGVTRKLMKKLQTLSGGRTQPPAAETVQGA